MRFFSTAIALAVLGLTPLGLTWSACAASVVPQSVDIPDGTVTLRAQLFKPEGNGPFPVVIALHGCGGLGGRPEPVQIRYRDWAEQLLKDGKAVLFPDSYGSRELGPQCHVRERRITARRERVSDILASRQWLIQQAWAAHDRISLLG